MVDVDKIKADAKKSWGGSFKRAAADVDALCDEVEKLQAVAKAAVEYRTRHVGDKNAIGREFCAEVDKYLS
jgi:hypothetical protein